VGYKMNEIQRGFTYAHLFANACITEIQEIEDGINPHLDDILFKDSAKQFVEEEYYGCF